jgi:hypothetical protein
VYFANEEYALIYLDKLKKTSKRSVVPHRTYLCEKCLSWHLTSKKTIDELRIERLLSKIKHSENLEKHILKLKKRIEVLQQMNHNLRKSIK